MPDSRELPALPVPPEALPWPAVLRDRLRSQLLALRQAPETQRARRAAIERWRAWPRVPLAEDGASAGKADESDPSAWGEVPERG